MADFKEKEIEYVEYKDTPINQPEQKFEPTIIPGINSIPPRFKESTIDFQIPFFLGLFVSTTCSDGVAKIIPSDIIRTNYSISPYDPTTNSIIIPSDGLYEISYNISPTTVIGNKMAEHFVTIDGITNIAYFENQFTQTNGQTCMGSYIGNFTNLSKINISYIQHSGSDEIVYGFISLKRLA